MLYEDLKNVPDFDDLSEEAGAEGAEHRKSFWGQLRSKNWINLHVWRIVVVDHRYLQVDNDLFSLISWRPLRLSICTDVFLMARVFYLMICPVKQGSGLDISQ